MNSLISLVDLIDVDGEARIRDLRLAEALGFARPRDIRKLIERYHGRLEAFGVCATVAQTPGPLGGRPTIVYALNAKQAAFIATRSDLPIAIDFTFAMIDVFKAWRDDAIPQLEASKPEIVKLKRGGRRAFTDEQVKEIRKAFAAGGVSKSELGRRYGVSDVCIYYIVTGQTYCELPMFGLPTMGLTKGANDQMTRLTRRLERLEQRLAA